jgi:hypothetical protein
MKTVECYFFDNKIPKVSINFVYNNGLYLLDPFKFAKLFL